MKAKELFSDQPKLEENITTNRPTLEITKRVSLGKKISLQVKSEIRINGEQHGDRYIGKV